LVWSFNLVFEPASFEVFSNERRREPKRVGRKKPSSQIDSSSQIDENSHRNQKPILKYIALVSYCRRHVSLM